LTVIACCHAEDIPADVINSNFVFFSDPIQQIYRVVKNGREQASQMKEETKS